MKDRIKPGKQGVTNFLQFIKNLKDTQPILLFQPFTLRLNFVNSFLLRRSLSFIFKPSDITPAEEYSKYINLHAMVLSCESTVLQRENLVSIIICISLKKEAYLAKGAASSEEATERMIGAK
jgi:uncharacterized membrane protein